MKHRKLLTLPKINPNKLAAQLKGGCGKDRAQKIADRLAKELTGISTGDVNEEIFKMKEIRKSERIWTQVSNILQKGK